MTGDGTPVLLLHSTVCDRRMWDPQVPVLAGAGCQVIRCDFPGFGETPMPTESQNEADDVSELLDRLDVGATAVIAASGGGQVGLEFASRWPARVTSLILLCTAWGGHERGPELRAFGAREDELLEAGDVAAAVELNVETWVGPAADEATRDRVRVMQRHAFEVQLAAVDVPPSIGHETELKAITAPTLLVSGAHDLPDFRQTAAELAGLLPGSQHVELDWAGHLPSLERPDLVNPLLLSFLRDRP
ncbi:hypothetical protein AFR_06625 [Actinoplanes friuliensis DSM 7358]|uniref:AB hydrolase-1 domain-containing protein n=1 Tax=Actinoplanes friuliensis DSM 7358 TaxID=1246995 RepID=U5VS02_9ACTN|nr:hypothetical protein AFR_06625 [Actinoplanes friuliensis DSM 7358]